MIVDLSEHRRVVKRPAPPIPTVVLLLQRAEAFNEALATGAANSRAALARANGLSRARVTQLLKLMDLHPTVRAFVVSLPAGTGAHAVSERKLRAIAQLEPEAQLAAAARLPGFRSDAGRPKRLVARGTK
ncbi:MAG: hypothetical protein AAF447_07220 [Myxococcota bacterium]